MGSGPADRPRARALRTTTKRPRPTARRARIARRSDCPAREYEANGARRRPGVSHAQGAQNFYSEGCSHRPRSGGHPMDEFVQDYETFDLGNVVLQGGATLRDAKLAYKTYGQLNGDKSNAIVYPTWYSGRHWDNEWLIGEGMAL